MRRIVTTAFVLGAWAAMAAGCGGWPLTSRGPVVPGPVVEDVLSLLAQEQPVSSVAVVVGLTPEPVRLVAFDPSVGKVLWTRPVAVKTAPMLAGDAVLFQTTDGRVVAFALADGHKVLDVEVSDELVGASGKDSLFVLTLARGPKGSPRSLVMGARSGDVLWTREAEYEAGAPAMAGKLVVVPWAGQRVSVLDAATGDEKLRFTTPTMVTQAFVDNGHTYLGANEIYRVAPGIDQNSKVTELRYTPLRRSLPSAPTLLRNGQLPAPAPSNASFKVRLVWRGTTGEKPLGLENDTVYLLFYRFVFAFAAGEDRLLWAYAHPEDIVGAASNAKGLVLVDGKGQVTLLEAAKGLPRSGTGVAETLQLAVIAPGVFEGQETAAKVQPIEERLRALAIDSDSRLAEGRALAARYLAAVDSERATEVLVELCGDGKQPQAVRTQACQGLAAGRSKGQRFVREGLARRASFLESQPAPPAGSLGLAAASMKISSTVPDLLAHLADPATSASELEGVVKALGVLGNTAAAERVAAFLALYHAEPEGSELLPALVQATVTLSTIQKAKSHATLEAIAKDPFTSAKLRNAIADVVKEKKKASETGTEAEKVVQAKEEQASESTKIVEDKRPERLSDKDVRTALKPVLPTLKKCLGKTLSSVKLLLMVDPQGRLVTQGSTPPAAQECLGPVLEKVSFPATKAQEPQRVVFMLVP